jgi:hypothetical protein
MYASWLQCPPRTPLLGLTGSQRAGTPSAPELPCGIRGRGVGSAALESAGSGEASLHGDAVSAASETLCSGELVTTADQARLGETRLYMRSREVFLHEIHFLAPVRNVACRHLFQCFLQGSSTRTGVVQAGPERTLQVAALRRGVLARTPTWPLAGHNDA